MLRAIAIAATAVLFAAPAQALISLDAFDQGWYNDVGDHGPANINTFTGFNGANVFHSFYAFDLASVGGTATSATLEFLPDIGSYNSTDPSEIVRIWDVTTPTATLLAGGGGLGAYDDLGAGVALSGPVEVFGTFGSSMPGFSVGLNGDGLAAVNAAIGGNILFGAALDNLIPGSGVEGLWAFSENPPAARLMLDVDAGPPSSEIPVPAAMPLALGAFAALGWAARRRQG